MRELLCCSGVCLAYSGTNELTGAKDVTLVAADSQDAVMVSKITVLPCPEADIQSHSTEMRRTYL